MPLPEYLNKFNPDLLNKDTYEDFKSAILKEYGNDVTALETKATQAEAKYGDYEKEIATLKAANWDMWKQLPGGKSEEKTNSPQPEALEDGDAPSIESFFAPPKTS